MGLILVFALLYGVVLLILAIKKLFSKEVDNESVYWILSRALTYSILIILSFIIMGVLSSIHDFLELYGCRMY